MSLVFLSPLVGYVLAASLNNQVHLHWGQRGISAVGPGCHIVAYIMMCVHPPYPVLVVAFVFAGFGNGLQDAAWNAWIGAFPNANEFLGLLHGLYGAGAVLSPLTVTSLITRAHVSWYYYYYIMVYTFDEFYYMYLTCATYNIQVGLAALELAICLPSFWTANGTSFREATARSRNMDNRGGLRDALFKRPSARVTWICASFLLAYVGVEVALGGWIVTFMIQVRKGAAFASGMTATGFWLGIAVGRVTLGFVTPRIGEKISITVCIS